MALFQPTNVIPSSLSGVGNGTVDAAKPLTVSWTVNGNSPMVAYRIKIMQNDAASTLKLDTGKVTLPSPFFGADALGNPVAFSTEIPAVTLAAGGIVNGYENGYKLSIEQWWTADDSVEQTSASFFITRSTPTVVMQIIPYRNQFMNQTYTFEALYSQAQGDTVEWYRWELQVKEDGTYRTLADTGEIYNGGMIAYGEGSIYNGFYGIQFTYTGFSIGVTGSGEATGIEYRIRCTVQTGNGVQEDSGWETFRTQSIFGGYVTLKLCAARDRDAVEISLPPNFPLLGRPYGPYDYTTVSTTGYSRYAIALPQNSFVTWGEGENEALHIGPERYTIVLRAKITSVSARNDYFTATGESKSIIFSYDADGFYIKDSDSVTIWSKAVSTAVGDRFSIALTPDNVYFFIESNGQTQISNTPVLHEWSGLTTESVCVRGPVCFLDVLIDEGSMAYADFSSLVSISSAPVFKNGTQLILAFSHTLFTGNKNIGALSGVILPEPEMTNKIGIYRKKTGEHLFSEIVLIPLNAYTKDAVIFDYSALSLTEYEYYMVYMVDDYLRARDGIASIKPCFWNYTVLCCQQNSIGVYVVKSEYRFSLDLSSGNVGNNNSPQIQQNFTRYPTRQPVANNYRSGSLSGYIGKVENGEYVDSVNLMEDLYALSTNQMTKFLKTRKGQIFQIETSAPVSMNIGDKYAQQPAKITLPWVEIGDAGSANILNDSSFTLDVPTFSVDPETMELTMTYNTNSVMGKDSFALYDQDLYIMNPGSYSVDDFSLNANREVILMTD